MLKKYGAITLLKSFAFSGSAPALVKRSRSLVRVSSVRKTGCSLRSWGASFAMAGVIRHLRQKCRPAQHRNLLFTPANCQSPPACNFACKHCHDNTQNASQSQSKAERSVFFWLLIDRLPLYLTKNTDKHNTTLCHRRVVPVSWC